MKECDTFRGQNILSYIFSGGHDPRPPGSMFLVDSTHAHARTHTHTHARTHTHTLIHGLGHRLNNTSTANVKREPMLEQNPVLYAS